MTSELTPFVRALREIAADAGLVLLDAAGPDTLLCATTRYNLVCRRLIALRPVVATVFRRLPLHASPGTLRLAARDMAALVCDLPAPSGLTMPHRLRRGPRGVTLSRICGAAA